MANSNVGVPPQKSLFGQSGLNAQGPVLDGGDAHSYHSLIVLTSAGVSAGTVVIELSNDNVNWWGPASNSVTTNAASTVFGVAVGPFPAQYVRSRISLAITGGSVTSWIASA